jgi:DNA-binding response OmpR family regulator
MQIATRPDVAARGLPAQPSDLAQVIDDLRRTAATAARLCGILEACLERANRVLNAAPANDDGEPAEPAPPAIQLVGRVTPPRRLVGPVAVHGLQVDPGRHTVQIGERQALLTPNEWQLFALLLAEPNRTFSRDELATGAWGHGYGGRDSEVEVYISRLRRKLEADPRNPLMIETVRGSGYRLVPPDDTSLDGAAPAAG